MDKRRIPLLTSLACLAALALGGSVGTAASQAKPAAVPGEILVGFQGDVSSADQRGALAKAGAVEKREFKRINGSLARVNPDDVEQALEKLRKDKRVRYAEPNFVYSIEATPNDPSYGALWGLNNGSDRDIDAPEAWDTTTGSNSVTVAVIDTGIDHAHPDLSAAIWTNPGENCAGCRTDGHDNDGNGYVDDWRGWDFVSDDNNPADDQGHGTHVAGTIGAVGNNGIGITGVNWQVRLMPVKFLNSAGSGTTADAISAVLYAADNGADVLNNSWAGDEYSQALGDAIAATDAQGALFVAAAGNDGNDNDATPTYPASYEMPNVLSVAATDSSDQPAWFSNYGRSSVDLGAPGVSIYSTYPGGSYQSLSGTSMAAPHVAGAAGLAKAAFPAATALGLKALLLDSADPVASLAAITASGARLNAASAVRCADAPKLWLDAPGAGSEAEVGIALAIRAIATRCAESGGVTISATANGAPVALASRGDGFYSGTFTPSVAGPVAISVTATAGGSSRTRTITLNASGVYTIAPNGPPVTVTTSAPNENARLRFEGQAGQRVSLKLSGVTISTSYVSFRNANGTALGQGAYVFGSGGFVDTTTLPATGTYTILVDPQGAATGSMTATLYDVPADATGTIAPGGNATIGNATPGQNARLTFAGQAGKRVSLKLSGVTISTSSVSIYKPDGGALGSPAYFGTAGGFVDTRTLPATGSYTILVDPQAAATGSMTATLYDVPADAGGAISAGGPAVAAAITTPGQNGRLEFDGTAGQRVSVKLSSVTIAGSYVSIQKADGTSVGASAYVGNSGGFVDTRTLPETGRYTILVDPQGAATGSMTANLYDVPADAASAITAGGPAVAIAATTPGQNARLTFNGQAGQRISVKVGPTTMSSSAISIINPEGKALANPTYAGSSGGFVDTRELPAAGTYTILVDPQGAATGSATVTLYDVPEDIAGTFTVGGPATPVTIATPGQDARFTFEGRAGQRITLQLSSVTISLSYVTIWRSDGTRIGPNNMVTTAGRTITADLGADGTYTIVIDPQAAAAGSMTVTLT